LASKKGIATCKPSPNFSPEHDATALYDVVNKSKNKDAIINIVAYRSSEQRNEIEKIYKVMRVLLCLFLICAQLIVRQN
jgi:hypothetical protein